MTIEKVLTQLQAQTETPERARELASMAYMQWLGSLPGHSSYESQAVRAWLRAQPFVETDPAVAAFCALLRQSLQRPGQPLDLPLPRPQRRGGARQRRLSI
ncbi:hypothetical protein KUV73_14505 [Mameliella alba]|nr:hypothetical protein [Mameliella alba]MBY6170565.1 hypothetical protein [Mameliella alba]MBY6175583.1 hypothetical protein [Mameliella alba]